LCVISLLIGAASGWMTLARQFRLTSSFTGPTWGAQSAQMRWTVRYGHCLPVGADVIGLYLSALFLFRIGHPPLFLPWSEISVWKRRKFLWFRYVELRLGREAQLPFMIDSHVADRIREAAETNWPIEPVS
jgi:hypothetical protein